MPSVFHAVPETMAGTVLYPLNELKRRAPEVWSHEVEKYTGREAVLELRIPILDCLWNDVLHFTTVHPADLAAALRAAGLKPHRRRFFEVDATTLDPHRTLLYLNRRRDRSLVSEWRRFEPRDVARLSRVRQRARRYYADCAARGTRPLVYAYLPHVLHRGAIETRDLPIVEV